MVKSWDGEDGEIMGWEVECRALGLEALVLRSVEWETYVICWRNLEVWFSSLGNYLWGRSPN